MNERVEMMATLSNGMKWWLLHTGCDSFVVALRSPPHNNINGTITVLQLHNLRMGNVGEAEGDDAWDGTPTHSKCQASAKIRLDNQIG